MNYLKGFMIKSQTSFLEDKNLNYEKNIITTIGTVPTIS